MALVVETGDIVETANSYVDLTSIRSYALDRGTDLSAVADATLNAYAIKAMDYLESLRANYNGYKVSTSQPLQFPRNYLYIDGNLFDYQSIPQELKNAQCELVLLQYDSVDISENVIDGNIKKKRVGPLEVEYFSGSSTTTLTKLMKILSPLLGSSWGQPTVARA